MRTTCWTALWAVMLSIGLGASLPAQKPAAATGLAAGLAKGTLTVKGQAIALRHAYAALEENPFDAAANDIVVVLTDTPISAGVLAKEDLGGLPGAPAAANIRNYLRIKLRVAEASEKDMERAILRAWVIGHRTISHEALKGKTLQISPDPISYMAASVIRSDRVEGVVYTDGSQTFPHDDEHEFKVAFNARVMPRKAPAVRTAPSSEPGLDRTRAQRLPAGGGDPGKAYAAYNKALSSADVDALRRLDLSLAAASAEEIAVIRKLLPAMASMAPADLKITGGLSDGSMAVLDLEATVMGERKKGRAEMTLVGGAWKLAKDSWQ